ncbi:SPOR domain-containing protein [Flavobacterium sp.]|uniref:HU domain-containing protein n=1 Tax=Flavobacterium sp. TaxID=239 RepID=UPI00261093EB|nr:SPOR domain-containing protein [Flavobacterium sp.]
MKIERFISELLYRYQCVTVPGFGGFIAEIQSAVIDPEKGLCIPPKKTISFNVNLRHNDGLLASHIAKAEKISFDTALNLIRAEVAFVEDQLAAKQRVELRNIGTLEQTNFGAIRFEPANDVNYYTAAFGLSNIRIPQRYVEEIQNASAPVIESQPKVIELEQQSRSQFNAWKYASAAVLILGVSGFFGNQAYDTYVEEKTAEVRATVQQKVTQEIQKATFVIASPSETLSLPVSTPDYKYHVVAGAFRDQKNANAVLSDLKSRGFEARSLPKNRFGLTPVLFGSYTKYGEAKAALTHIHQTQTQDAWLLVE